MFICNIITRRNRVNLEKETRWSINCRFKGAFTPYGDKKLGEFFEPITLRIASQIGMQYKIPKINEVIWALCNIVDGDEKILDKIADML